mmetsp:Transcript_15885/g.36838  ORF Transcript_15885/g.36838 Transcript_15885/m.36838 type:complete len:229 (+) Transcript_15885:214-900(+)
MGVALSTTGPLCFLGALIRPPPASIYTPITHGVFTGRLRLAGSSVLLNSHGTTAAGSVTKEAASIEIFQLLAAPPELALPFSAGELIFNHRHPLVRHLQVAIRLRLRQVNRAPLCGLPQRPLLGGGSTAPLGAIDRRAKCALLRSSSFLLRKQGTTNHAHGWRAHKHRHANRRRSSIGAETQTGNVTREEETAPGRGMYTEQVVRLGTHRFFRFFQKRRAIIARLEQA